MSNHDFTSCGNPERRHDFILLFDVQQGNPNGDPDMDNMPRQDTETNHGLVTDVCLKRKVRNYISLTQDQEKGNRNRIYVQDKGIYLNDLHKEAHQNVGIPDGEAKKPKPEKLTEARSYMCANFYDVRMFGAVMSTGVNCGQVRGPIQMTFASSIDPILSRDDSISRVALTDKKEEKSAEKGTDTEGAEEERFGRTGTFGRKATIPYGLYLGHGFFTVPFAKQTGVQREDLELFWTALINTWDLDHSASRGMMACRGLYVFSHENGLGNAPSHTLFDRLSVTRNDGVEAPRRFSDYTVALDGDALPSGVTLTRLVG